MPRDDGVADADGAQGCFHVLVIAEREGTRPIAVDTCSYIELFLICTGCDVSIKEGMTSCLAGRLGQAQTGKPPLRAEALCKSKLQDKVYSACVGFYMKIGRRGNIQTYTID